MTWSLLAVDESGALGVAIASKFFAVGSLCPGIVTGKGALSTQALMNPLYRRPALAALSEGMAPEEIVRRVTGGDEGRDVRQFHVLDASGHSAAHTGRACIDWCGSVSGRGYSIAGNMLAGPQVLDETARAFEGGSKQSLPERMLAAMDAGEKAGGDKRGRQGAALLIHTTEEYPFLDLRVDDHPEPLAELRRLHAVSLERFQAFVGCLPSRANAAGILDRAVIEARVAELKAARRRG